MLFNIFKGEYPFNEHLGTIEASNADDACRYACQLFPKSVVEPADFVPVVHEETPPTFEDGDGFVVL